jgi:hypothetical protein
VTDLEDRIRESLQDPRRQLPVWPDPMPRILRAARRQRAGLAAGIGLLAAVIAVAVVVPVLALRSSTGAGPGLSTSSSPSPRHSVPAPPPPGWVRHTARAWPQSSWQGPSGAVSIDAPAAWHFNRNPAPALLSPTMLFAVGTGPVPTGGSCAPTAALKTLPANGALFVLYESSQYDYTHAGLPPRPERLRLGAIGGPYECWGVKGYVIRFADGGRFFQAQAVFGPHAPASLRAEVTRSLNTLHVDPLPSS